jgi:uncharacterized protein YbjQ (UPF0145 family)
MKTKDIASQYGLKQAKFEAYLLASSHKSQIKENFWNDDLMIDDNVDIQMIVNDFIKIEDNLAKKEEEKKTSLANMLITSGFNFDGYTITKYSGYISGDDAISVPRGMTLFGSGTDVKDKLMQSLVIIRRKALAELKEAAYALGCNAVIGVDFDYLTLDPQNAGLGGHTVFQPYVFGVTANGNAVVIEKNE